jgi:hypothetical protein
MRVKTFREVCELVGYPGVSRVIDERDGWPGLVKMNLPSSAEVGVALHVSHVSSHSRAQYEMRFQNPANSTAVMKPRGYLPVLVGLESNNPAVLVAVNANSRVGRTKRFSILFNGAILTQARANGWALYTSNTDEQIFAFRPSLLPVFIEMTLRSIDGAAASAFSDDVAGIANASGILVDDSESARARTRRSAEILTRHYAFGRKIVRAYSGRCAMCGINSGLVVAAHIYPVSAPGSQDILGNGLALCANHHAAFDAHKIHVQPNSKKISVHPIFIDDRDKNPALDAFINSTKLKLVEPDIRAAAPSRAMFDRRYKYYRSLYEWV